MDLVTLRQKFVEVSGRYDLVVDTTDWADDGADFFIQEGQNMIERLSAIVPESEGRIWETVAIDAYYVSFQKRCRSIIEVWANNSEERFELDKIDWKDLKEYYADTIAETDSGEPAYYCPAKLREIDVADKDATGAFLNYTRSDSKDYRGILILPPVDEAYDIEILGNFYQAALTSDDDENFWTVLHSGILIKAAIYQCEIFYRSKRRLDGMLRSLLDDVEEVSKDVVAEEVTDVEEMDG